MFHAEEPRANSPRNGSRAEGASSTGQLRKADMSKVKERHRRRPHKDRARALYPSIERQLDGLGAKASELREIQAAAGRAARIPGQRGR